jgi:metal-responsive CopG/Arc/MetJ family transcriptional regulator
MAKVMISMPEGLLSRVDERAKTRGTSRSALIREALIRYLAEPVDLERRRAVLDELRRRRAGRRWTSEMTPEEMVRYDRDHQH